MSSSSSSSLPPCLPAAQDTPWHTFLDLYRHPVHWAAEQRVEYDDKEVKSVVPTLARSVTLADNGRLLRLRFPKTWSFHGFEQLMTDLRESKRTVGDLVHLHTRSTHAPHGTVSRTRPALEHEASLQQRVVTDLELLLGELFATSRPPRIQVQAGRSYQHWDGKTHTAWADILVSRGEDRETADNGETVPGNAAVTAVACVELKTAARLSPVVRLRELKGQQVEVRQARDRTDVEYTCITSGDQRKALPQALVNSLSKVLQGPAYAWVWGCRDACMSDGESFLVTRNGLTVHDATLNQDTTTASPIIAVGVDPLGHGDSGADDPGAGSLAELHDNAEDRETLDLVRELVEPNVVVTPRSLFAVLAGNAFQANTKPGDVALSGWPDPMRPPTPTPQKQRVEFANLRPRGADRRVQTMHAEPASPSPKHTR
ncbi:uncharacterized protein EHS24_006688 [Apiotrichum porosum]|uniref:Uncharacterized protein n=1 Tax=Apiotrichum porosum TaxID=105984 RepID=A0A427Y289_9TREE|nr:uncharacterized protein EHS24_006688 [Apiotrichum porosum]RSH85095.1 hypothetical protein EHS24_006688 [Apiotrichum porosum]